MWSVFGFRWFRLRIFIRQKIVNRLLSENYIDVMSMDIKHVQITLFNFFLNIQSFFLELLLVHVLYLVAFDFLLKARSFELTFSKILNKLMKLFFDAY